MFSCRYSLKTVARRYLIILFILSFLALAATSSTIYAQDNVTGDAVPAVTASTYVEAQMTGCGSEIVPTSNEEYEATIVVLTNQIRIQHGLLPLKRVPMLNNAGRYHATDMALEDYFAHNSQDLVNGEYVETCSWSSRIQTYYTNWSALAENIAAGYPSPESVMAGWMDSDGHRDNILNEHLSEIGVGYYTGAGSYRHYWVQDFGGRRDVYPLVVDLDAPVTENGAVTIHLHGDWEQVRLRTNDGPWSEWQPFAQGMTWQIIGAPGEHTVHAEMRSGTKSASSSDTIHLAHGNLIPPKLSELPEQLSFVYYSRQQMLTPSTHLLRPIEEAMEGYRWQIRVDGHWLNVTPNESSTADPVEMRVEVSSAGSIQNSTATVTVDLLDAANNVVDSHTTSVVLEIINEEVQQLFLPTVIR